MKKITLLLLGVLCFNFSISQTSEVIITVNWPNWSSENKVELFDPSGNAITPVIQNAYDGATDNSYNVSTNFGFLPNANNYSIIVYDRYGDGWNGSGNMTITRDGATAFTFDGVFSTSGTNVEVTDTFTFDVKDPEPGDTFFYKQTNEDTRDYIEYIKGNLPIIISAPHGGVKQSGSTIGQIQYPDNDSTLPDRTCGTVERDDNTDILLREIQEEIFNLTGCYAHVIINNLHRSKLDPNRAQAEATCGDADAIDHWNAWHNYIDQASTDVETNWGKGLYIDLHGQSHAIARIEAGYNISATELNAGSVNGVTGTSITSLVANNLNSYTQDELVRGPFSLGQYFQDAPGTFYNANNNPGCGVTSGYRTLPSNTNHGGGNSCDDTQPFTNAYFDGDFYNNVRHGSGIAASDGLGGSGNIDGIMTEVNRRVRDLGTYNGRIFDTRPQTLVPFAKDYAAVVLEFMDKHYNNFTEFNYSAAIYDTSDTDPTPTITGVSGGVFSSTTGLIIDASTGVIDVSSSTAGNYTVTYEAGICGYYNSTFDIEITGSTLSLDNFEVANFKLYPNPTKGSISFKSETVVNNLKIYNLIGQEVLQLNSNKKEDTIDLSNLKNGSYIIKFFNNENTIGNKMIIKN